MNYETVKTIDSQVLPGVTFSIARMSFGRRVELMRRVRELSRQMEYLEAGPQAGDKMDAALLVAEINRLFVKWGVLDVRGLQIDGSDATPATLADAAPEALFREALQAVRSEIGLSEEERKN